MTIWQSATMQLQASQWDCSSVPPQEMRHRPESARLQCYSPRNVEELQRGLPDRHSNHRFVVPRPNATAILREWHFPDKARSFEGSATARRNQTQGNSGLEIAAL